MGMQATTGTVPRSSDELDAADNRRSHRWRPVVFSAAVYVVLAMIVFGHFDSLGPGHMSGQGSSDAIEGVWWLAWAAFAVSHGLNVFSASWFNYPFGQNFGDQATSMLLLGVVLLPITKLFGPIVAWNIAVRLALAASAMSMFLVLRRWCTWWPAAFVGGLLYGFSSYIIWYARGVYLFLIFVPLPPIIFLVLHEILVRQRWRPITAGIVLAVLCTFQFFVSPEILASTLLIGAIAAILIVVANRRLLIAHWRYPAASFGWAALGTVVLLAFPLLFTFTGPEHISGQIFNPTLAVRPTADLLSPVVPNGQWIDPKAASLASSNPFENSLSFGGDLYLGLPLIIALICFAVFLRKRRAILFAGSMVLICFVLSLGNPLWADGHRTQIPLPFAVIQHLPVFQGILNDRLSLFTSLFAAGMFAIGLDELRVRIGRPRLGQLSRTETRLTGGLGAAFLVGIVVLALVPDGAIAATVTGPPVVPSFFSSKAIDTVPAGSVALTYPYVDPESTSFISTFFPARSEMLNQAVSGMRFKLIGGYGYFASPSGHPEYGPAALEPTSVQALFDVAFMGGTPKERALLATRSLPADLRRFLQKYDVSTVIIDPLADWQMVATQVSAALGSPIHDDGVVLWSHVQQRLRNGSAR